MTWGMVAVAGASLVGGAMSADAAGDASDAQAASAREANQLNKEISDNQIALQREQFNRSIEMQEPFRQSGLNATNKLNYLLGLSETGRGATDPQITAIRNRLLPQFTQYSNTPGLRGAELDAAVNAEVAKWAAAGFNATEFDRNNIRQAKSTGGSSQVTRDVELEAAVQAELAKSQTASGQAGGRGSEFGSLMRDFGMADYEADPGLAFRREEGEKALTRAAGASGQLGSGRYLKDAMRFNSGLASQEYGNAYNRFQVNRSNKLNPLQSMAGLGQTSANTMSQAGQNFANSASNALGTYGASTGANILGAGNARASGYIAQGNALQNALNGGVSAWKNYQPSSGGGGSGWSTGSGFGGGINPNSGEFMGSLEF
jgi:hypothetical protein